MSSALLEQTVVGPRQVAELRVCTSDIVFRNAAPGRVRLSVRVANVGIVRSESATMIIQAAPLGAFVRWKEVTTLLIPPIQPHGYVEVATELSAPGPANVLGQFSRVPPRRLLTAVASSDDARPPANPATALAQYFLRLLGGRPGVEPATQLPGDPLQLLSRPSVHWAGNINVLIGRQAVERHLAHALRIYPGHTNLAVFFVGDRHDEYRFKLSGSGAAWEAALFDFTQLGSLIQRRSPSLSIPPAKWIPMEGCRMVLLAICPPPETESGSIEVHVEQRSTGRDAVVEFSLDANAAGSGCYTV